MTILNNSEKGKLVCHTWAYDHFNKPMEYVWIDTTEIIKNFIVQNVCFFRGDSELFIQLRQVLQVAGPSTYVLPQSAIYLM